MSAGSQHPSVLHEPKICPKLDRQLTEEDRTLLRMLDS